MKHFTYQINGIPQVWFSHRYQTNHYANSFPAFPEGLEITYILEGAVHWQQQGSQQQGDPLTHTAPPLVVVSSQRAR